MDNGICFDRQNGICSNTANDVDSNDSNSIGNNTIGFNAENDVNGNVKNELAFWGAQITIITIGLASTWVYIMINIFSVITYSYLILASSMGWAFKPPVLFLYTQSLSYTVFFLVIRSFENIQNAPMYNNFLMVVSTNKE